MCIVNIHWFSLAICINYKSSHESSISSVTSIIDLPLGWISCAYFVDKISLIIIKVHHQLPRCFKHVWLSFLKLFLFRINCIFISPWNTWHCKKKVEKDNFTLCYGKRDILQFKNRFLRITPEKIEVIEEISCFPHMEVFLWFESDTLYTSDLV